LVRKQPATLAPVINLSKNKNDSEVSTTGGFIGTSSFNLPYSVIKPKETTTKRKVKHFSAFLSTDPEWQFEDEYDPLWPNDYEKALRELRDRRDKEAEEEESKRKILDERLVNNHQHSFCNLKYIVVIIGKKRKGTLVLHRHQVLLPVELEWKLLRHLRLLLLHPNHQMKPADLVTQADSRLQPPRLVVHLQRPGLWPNMDTKKDKVWERRSKEWQRLYRYEFEELLLISRELGDNLRVLNL